MTALPAERRTATGLAAAVLATSLLLAGNPARAAELSVRAPVVDVQPIMEASAVVEYCAEKPANAAGLSAILAWDLGLTCRTERVPSDNITGYRVFYRWDDRVYSQVMKSAPGDTVALTIRLD